MPGRWVFAFSGRWACRPEGRVLKKIRLLQVVQYQSGWSHPVLLPFSSCCQPVTLALFWISAQRTLNPIQRRGGDSSVGTSATTRDPERPFQMLTTSTPRQQVTRLATRHRNSRENGVVTSSRQNNTPTPRRNDRCKTDKGITVLLRPSGESASPRANHTFFVLLNCA